MDSRTEGQSYNVYQYLQQPSKTKFTDLSAQSVTQDSTLTVKQRKLDLNVDPATTNTDFSMGKLGNNVQATTTNTCFSIGKLANNVDPTTINTCFSVGKQANNIDPTITNTGFSVVKPGNNVDTSTQCTDSSVEKSGFNLDQTTTVSESTPSCTKISSEFYVQNSAVNTNLSVAMPISVESSSSIQCDICSCSFTSETKLNRHMKLHTRPQIFNECSVCGKEFVKISALNKHMERCQCWCTTCFEVFKHRWQLQYHGQLCKSSEVYHCDVCHDKFDHLFLLNWHIDEKHCYKCTVCTRMFTTSVQLERHVAIQHAKHGKDYVYRCGICYTNCTDIDELRAHMINHWTENPYKCYMCATVQCFSDSTGLQAHMVAVHPPLYMCTVCPRTFVEIDAYEKHANSHIRERCKCPICGKVFSPITTLETHMGIHALKHKCEDCFQSFTKRTDLDEHTESEHTGEKLYKCIACEETFTDRSGLNKHRTTHMGPNSYPCFKCNLTFSHALQLNDHMAIHKGSPKRQHQYKCPKCDSYFEQALLLNIHMKTHKVPERDHHTAATVYTCTECNLPFRHAFELNEHMLVHEHLQRMESKQELDVDQIYSQSVILIKPEPSINPSHNCLDVNPGHGLDLTSDKVVMVIKPVHDILATPDSHMQTIKTEYDIENSYIPIQSIKDDYNLDITPDIYGIQPNYDCESMNDQGIKQDSNLDCTPDSHVQTIKTECDIETSHTSSQSIKQDYNLDITPDNHGIQPNYFDSINMMNVQRVKENSNSNCTPDIQVQDIKSGPDLESTPGIQVQDNKPDHGLGYAADNTVPDIKTNYVL